MRTTRELVCAGKNGSLQQRNAFGWIEPGRFRGHKEQLNANLSCILFDFFRDRNRSCSRTGQRNMERSSREGRLYER